MVQTVWIQVIPHSANARLDLLEVFVKEVCKLMVTTQVVSSMFSTNLMLLQLPLQSVPSTQSCDGTVSG